MLNRFLSRQFNPESVRKTAKEFGIALVFLGTLGFLVGAVSVWVSVSAIVVGVAGVFYGNSSKA